MFHIFRVVSFTTTLLFITAADAVELGDSEVMVIKSYGEALKVTVFPEEIDFRMNKTKLAEYENANIEYHLRDGSFYVWRLELFGLPWTYGKSSIVCGQSQSDVETQFGKPEQVENKGEDQVWFYRFYHYDAWSAITFRNGKVLKIFAAEDWS